MKCPKCNVTLVMAERSGVEIDYCPECRGVWLDRGELDKIIERSAAGPHRDERRHPDDRGDKSYKGHYDDGHYKKKKRESFLGDLFDF
jgi:uncharacterized protein